MAVAKTVKESQGNHIYSDVLVDVFPGLFSESGKRAGRLQVRQIDRCAVTAVLLDRSCLLPCYLLKLPPVSQITSPRNGFTGLHMKLSLIRHQFVNSLTLSAAKRLFTHHDPGPGQRAGSEF